MKAVTVNPGKRTVDLLDIPEPRLTTPTQVKLRVLEVGVCGTDREIVRFDYGTPPEGSDFLVIGHECLAEIEALGEEVTKGAVGDLVVPMVRRPCPHPECAPCRAGRQDFCLTGDFTERGIKGRHGYMTESVVVDGAYLTFVPRALRDVAVLVEPLTIAEKALIQVAEIQERLPWSLQHAAQPAPASASAPAGGARHNALVIGAGPVGLLGAMALESRHYNTFVYSKEGTDSDKAALVKAIGATYLAAGEHPVESLPGTVGNIDLVYEAAGASRIAFDVMGTLGVNGIFVFTGVPGRRGPVELDTDRIMRDLVLKNQVVLGTVNAGRDAFANAVSDLAVFTTRWPDQVRALITQRHRPDDFEAPLKGPGGGIKQVIRFAEEGRDAVRGGA